MGIKSSITDNIKNLRLESNYKVAMKNQAQQNISIVEVKKKILFHYLDILYAY